MQTVHMTRADIARTRFATAPIPLLESSLALAARGASGRSGESPSAQLGRRQFLLVAAARPLLDLTIGPVGPVFLDPLVSDIDEGFELVRATPRAVINSELHRVLDRQAAPVPTWVRNLADGDREERQIVETSVRACYDQLVGPHLAEYDRAFEQDIASRMHDLRRGGIARVLSNLHPQLTFHDNILTMPHRFDQAKHLHGQGLELMPSPSWPGPPMLTWAWNDPDRHLLIYPAAPLATITPGVDAIARLVGSTRAVVLRQLRAPMTTGELATRLGVSVASASQHATVLRDAGLIDSRRSGRTVVHTLTGLGEALLAGGAAGATLGRVDRTRKCDPE